MARTSRGRTERQADTGFRRLRFIKAHSPRDLRSILDPSADGGVPAITLTNYQADALAKIDKIAETLFRKTIHQWHCTKEVAFALALDKTEPREKLRAIIARAFFRADQYAAEFANRLDDYADASDRAKILTSALDLLAGGKYAVWEKNERYLGLDPESAIGRSLKIIERYRFEPKLAIDARREGLTSGIAAIEEIRDVLWNVAEKRQSDGRTPDDARFFFALRLGEIFAISTGSPPDFHDSGRPDKAEPTNSRKSAPEWNALIKAALALTGLGEDGLDNRLRQMGGDSRGSKAWRDYCQFHKMLSDLGAQAGDGFDAEEGLDLLLDPAEDADLLDPTFQQQLSFWKAKLAATGFTETEARRLRESPGDASLGAAVVGDRLKNLSGKFHDNRTSIFCGGDLPSSGWLTDMKLVPEPVGYEYPRRSSKEWE